MTTAANVSAQEAKKIIEQRKGDLSFILLDVRTGMEYGMSHIDGSVNISSGDIESRLKDLDKSKFYLVYCRSGARSNSAANTMRANGFNKVTNMLGGISDWGRHEYPTTSNCCNIM
jgi:rhodanese-related sulfurtransferase